MPNLISMSKYAFPRLILLLFGIVAFGWPIGQIKTDFEADILVLDKNPLEDLENLNSIDRPFINGIEIDHQDLLVNYQNLD